MSLCPGLEAAGGGVVSFPVRIVHRVDTNVFARARCMDKTVIADIQADVIAAGATLGAEEHRIARLQFMLGNFLQFRVEHCSSGSWHVDTGFVLEQEHQHAAAIEALFQGHAAPQVRDTQQGVGAVDDSFDMARSRGFISRLNGPWVRFANLVGRNKGGTGKSEK